MRFRILVILSLLAGSATLALPAPAGATAPAMTVSPNSAIVDGNTLTISGTGFTPSSLLFACEGIVDSTPDSGDCGHGFTFDTDVNGSFTTTVAARRFITPENTGVQVDCADPSVTCGIGAMVTEDLNGPNVVVSIGFAPQTIVPRPDLIVRNRATGALIGDNVYSTSGSGIQTRSHLYVNGTWTYAVLAQNDGNQTDTLVVSAPAQEGVQYFVGYYNVTSLVNGGGLTWNLGVGQTLPFTVRGTLPPGEEGSSFAAIVSVHSTAAFELTDVLQLRFNSPTGS